MLIIETSIFTRQVTDLLSDEEYRMLQFTLAARPAAGTLIQGTGGLRKLRWSLAGRGKRGGVRVIYYWATRHGQLLMLLMYPKNVQDDVTPAQRAMLRSLLEEEYP